MTNSKLFIQAHKMTKLTIQPKDVYRTKFGQWLVWLKTGISNYIKPARKQVNIDCAMIGDHNKYGSGKLTKTYYLDAILINLLTNKALLFTTIMIQSVIILNLI